MFSCEREYQVTLRLSNLFRRFDYLSRFGTRNVNPAILIYPTGHVGAPTLEHIAVTMPTDNETATFAFVIAVGSGETINDVLAIDLMEVMLNHNLLN
jgi:hypothetical protein